MEQYTTQQSWKMSGSIKKLEERRKAVVFTRTTLLPVVVLHVLRAGQVKTSPRALQLFQVSKDPVFIYRYLGLLVELFWLIS